MWGGKKPSEEFDAELHVTEDTAEPADARTLRADTRETLRQALDRLPLEFREILVLREIQGLSYEEITQVAQIPMGTVMSRLSRARARLERALQGVTP
jgi:RNA polymerase sigma-70 factor (ECF subfamily)